jgi:FkbM family methyltransferase
VTGLRERLLFGLRDRSGGRISVVAKRLHTIGIFATGHGTAGLGVELSGERHVVELLIHQDSPVVFDVGAFEGEYALMVRRMLGGAATIHCFEPNPAAFARLKGHAGLIAHQVAVASTPGTRTLHEDPSRPTMASLEPEAQRPLGLATTAEISVEAVTLDGFCAEFDIDQVDLVKIDAEGAEIEVLRGATELLERCPIVQFEIGYANLASRTFLRDFYNLLDETHALYRVAPRGLVPLGDYQLELEVFVSATNYVAIPRS